MLQRRNVEARKLWKVGFAVSFVVAVFGAGLLTISQVPLADEYYDVVDTRSFSGGEPLTFSWDFEAGANYRVEVKGVDWTSQPVHSHHLSFRRLGDAYLSSSGEEPAEPPWVWYLRISKWAFLTTSNVTFWHYEDGSQVIDSAPTSASVVISQSRETTYRLTYLTYAGLPLLIIGAILTLIIGNAMDSRMGFLVFQSGWARLRTEPKIFLATFLLASVALFIIHLVYLPFYWASAPSHRVRPFDLYLPSVWTPAIIYYSVLIAVFAVVTFSLLSWLRSGEAYFAGAAIFMTTMFLGALGIYVLFGLAGLQFGYTMRLPFGRDPKGSYVVMIVTLLFAVLSAVATTAVYGCYKLVRWAGKRLKANAEP
jgi:hypothetical protein